MVDEEATLTDKDAARIEFAASSAFTPATPITAQDLFAGRTQQIVKVLDAIGQPGLHAILYGERGVGKTSLANVVSIISASRGNHLLTAKVNCEADDSFSGVWRKVLSEFTFTLAKQKPGFTAETEKSIQSLAASFSDPIDANQLRVQLGRTGGKFFIIFDEFDRLKSSVARSFTDVIKTFSDASLPVTVLLVGVADTIDKLIRDHASISRALVQIHMPRMQPDELAQIVKTGAAKIGVIFSEPSCQQIVQLSQGLPHYTHLMARNSAREAARRRSLVVTPDDVSKALATAVQDAQQTIKSQYHNAVSSSHKSALFREVLLACALAKKDSLSYFQAADVVVPLSKIMGQKYEIPAFARHLSKFCEGARGAVLSKSGEERRYRYRFSEPLLEPYIVMDGLAANLITPEKLASLSKPA